MGYQGNAYPIDCSKGGLTGSKTADALQPYMMVWPTRNINLHNNIREKRGGTSHIYAAALPGADQIMGLYDFVMRGGTQYIIAATKNGDIFKDDTNTIKTSASTSNYFSFETGEDCLFIADGDTQLQVWTGVGNTADVAHPAVDWTTDPPFQIVLHKRGNSQRMCAITTTALYVSKTFTTAGSLEDFLNTGAQKFPIEVNDGWGLVAEIEHNNELWLFGKTTSYRLLDTDATITNWGYTPSLFMGGVAHQKLLCRTPNNDLIAMMEDGEVYSINAVQSYGDYKRASLTAPSKMDAWIRENVNLSYIDQFHMKYDPFIRALRIFVVPTGGTTVSRCLVYFIDRTPEEAWMVHDNESYDSGFNASCSALVCKSTGVNKVYTGDYAGNLWELETAAKNDNNASIMGSFRSAQFSPENSRMNKFFKCLRPILLPQGDYLLQEQHWLDGTIGGTGSVNMSGGESLWDTAIFDTSTFALGQIIDEPIDIGDKGTRIQFELWNNGADQNFEISSVVVDAKILGAKT